MAKRKEELLTKVAMAYTIYENTLPEGAEPVDPSEFLKACETNIDLFKMVAEDIDDDPSTSIDERKAKVALEKSFAKAKDMLKDTKKVEDFLAAVETKASLIPQKDISEKITMVATFSELVLKYIKKEYTSIPIASIVAILGALIYFVNPADIVPDTIPGVGYVDDAVVIGICVKFINSDLKDFNDWKKKNK